MSDAHRASVFIGSSSEGLPIAEALQTNLDDICDAVIWSQGIFGLGQGTLEGLVKELPRYDYAILALTADDLVVVRGETAQSPRDNVLLELGLCIGILGRERTFAVFEKGSGLRMPSDLAGVTLAPYQLQRSGNLQASLGACTSRIKQAIRNMGTRSSIENSVFLAVPMNAFNVAGKPDEYSDFWTSINSLISTLRNECCISKVFCAAEDISDVEEFELPGASLAIDIEKIREHEYMMLIWLRNVDSKSVLIEAGMALAMGKKCIICAQNGSILPFLLKDSSAVSPNIKRVDFETMEELIDDMKRNKCWLFKTSRTV